MSAIQSISLIILFSVGRLIALEGRLDYLDAVPVEQAPYIALVLCTNSKYFCTGTILHERWVLTSAHCFYYTQGVFSEDDTTVLVVAGTNKLSQAGEDIKSGAAQIRQSVHLHINEHFYFSANFIFDLALIEVQTDFEITGRIRVAPLNRKVQFNKNFKTDNIEIEGFPEERKVCASFGFGKVYANEDNVNDGSLKKQLFNVSKSCQCLEIIWNLRWHESVIGQSQNMFFCEERSAEYTSLSGLCSGDQGAPLICDNFLAGMGTAAFHYREKDKCRLRKVGQNECGSRQTLYVFTNLCLFSNWLAVYVPGYPLVDGTCEPYQKMV